jgi:drug/metabolite transporter (DMT)-like permease
MFLGLLLAVICAAVTNASFLLRQRGAVESPDVDPRHPLRSARDLFASKWWTIGWLAAAGAWMLHVGALAFLQLSVVQAVVAGGLVFLAVLAERFFGFHLGRRQWIGLSITAAGLAVLGITGGPAGPGAGSSLGALIAVEGGVAAVSALLVVISFRLEQMHPAEGMILGVAAGTLFGVSDISLKYLTHAAHAGILAAIANGWVAAALAASVVAFYASARSLQIGPPLEVIAFTSIAANLIAIGGGIIVFHDSVGHGALQISGRMLAFALVIAGAAAMPAPRGRADPQNLGPTCDAAAQRSVWT